MYWRGSLDQRLLLLIAAVLVAGAVLFAWLRWDTRETAAQYVKRLADEAQVHFATFSFTPIAGIGDVATHLAAHAENGVGVELATVEQRSALFDAVSEHLRLRFGQDDPARYLEWRRSLGAPLRPTGTLREELARYLAAATGQEFTPEMTGEEAFALSWTAFNQSRSGGNVPSALAEAPESTYVSFKTLSSRSMSPPLHSMDKAHMRLWNGGIAYSSPHFTDTDPPLRTRLEAGTMLGGFVSSVVKYGDGVPRPTTWCLFWDESHNRWVLYHIAINNAVGDGVRPPDV